MISLDWTLGLQFVNFFILLIILNKFLYRPLLKVMAERRETVAGSHRRAKSLEAEIEEKMQVFICTCGQTSTQPFCDRSCGCELE